MFNILLTAFRGFRMLKSSTDKGAYDGTTYDVETDPSKLESFAEIAGSLHFVFKKILGPVLVIIGVLATCYAIYLGVMYAKAEDANRRKETLGRLIGACIGAVIIIAGIVVCFSVNWSDVYFSFQGAHEFKPSSGASGLCEYCGHGAAHTFHG